MGQLPGLEKFFYGYMNEKSPPIFVLPETDITVTRTARRSVWVSHHPF
jgi:hypothetical protein